MELDLERTCCFTGHRPDKLPWGADEDDPRCAALKESLEREIGALYQKGLRHFISGMARGTDLYFAQAVLNARERMPGLTLEGAVPCRTQASRWPERDRRRWRDILDRADLETLVQQDYDRWCMHRRDRYMVDRSGTVLAVFAGSSGGTMYTLNYAIGKGREILLLDLNHPEREATRLELQNPEPRG